ncbi:heterokaryon incompatibility protein Het-C-domain-containing protein [Xylariales sp. PMI_506]|nr:heterokaryon incompatibility protein Het-C-domain-containing protein [Xylariales sp. PMI_506]
MSSLKPYPAILALVLLLFYARPALAFGAGNIASISKVEGQNWRHGDIEDTLLTLLMARAAGGKKFDKLAVSRVYFGNWLRDYSQAIDVGTVKSVSAEAIRLLLSVLGFMTFGFGSKEFEVTADRLGCYRPEDHIDNPKGYPSPGVDARQYDRRLRGPVDERVELAIDNSTGLKNYIANEGVNIMTTALHIRKLFGRCIELGRSYNRNKNKDDLYEALRLMGTGLHACEDFLAHSNYIELALIELGERDVFPHVGRRTLLRLQGARGEVYPCVTGTFGGVDFLHSVTGEVSDKLTQNELDELEGTLQNNSRSDTSILANLLDMIPDGILGGNKKQQMQDIQSNAASSQMQNLSVSPREPEEFTRQVQTIFRQIMPAIEFHDDLLKRISEAIEKIPVLPKIIEQLEEQMSVWVFSIIAPFVVPVLKQVKNELRTGSNEIIESSKNEQHIVFDDDHCSDPTHSMLSKDHFSNILNEAAGKAASKVVAWVVPQLMDAWDNESIDIERTMNRIIHGVMHHPAQREMGDDGARDCRQIMIQSVQQWWTEMDRSQQDDYRRKLSRDGVLNGENHKEGVQDTGHGCGKPLGMHKNFGGQGGGTMEDRIAGAAVNAVYGGITGGIANMVQSETGIHLPGGSGGSQTSFGGSGGSGGLGGLLSSVGNSLLGGFKDEEKQTFNTSRQDQGSYTESQTEYGHSGSRYGQADYSRTQYSGGGEAETYRRYEQDEGRGGNTTGYSYEERVETRPSRFGGHEERSERTERYGSENTYERQEENSWGQGQRNEDRFEGRRNEQFGGRREDEFGGRREDFGERREEGFGGGFGGRREEYGERREEGFGGNSGGRRNDEYGERREEGFGGGFGGGRGDEYGGRRNNEYEEERRDEGVEGFVEGVLDNVGRFGGAFGGERREDEDRRGGWGF